MGSRNRPPARQAAPERISRQVWEYLEFAKRLRREGNDGEAEELLRALIEKHEAEASGRGVEHWYYEHLAALYHDSRDHAAERVTLERYLAKPQISLRMAAMMKRKLEHVSSGCVAGETSSR